MRKTIIALLVVLSGALLVAAMQPTPDASSNPGFAEAERLVKEGSYGLALERYDRFGLDGLSEEDTRWVLFRRADLQWRSAPEDSDDTPLQQAEKSLEKLLVDENGIIIEDRVRPEILESLGDYYWSVRRRNFGQAWQHYAQALDWWGRSRDLDEARDRYLAVVFKATSTSVRETWYPHGQWATSVPTNILENAVRIAKDPSDVARTNYLLALNLASRSDPETIERTRNAFEAALEIKGGEWRDDALFQSAQWFTRTGILEFDENGDFSARPDWEAALESYRALVAENRTGESRWVEQAQSQIDQITKPSLGLAVSNVFLPGSVIEFGIQWRNLGRVDYTLSSVDLIEALAIDDRREVSDWINAIDTSSARDRIEWTETLEAKRRYEPGQARVKVSRMLAPGAWILEATSKGTKARDLILVSDLAISARTTGESVLAWVVDARSGEPRDGAAIRIWTQRHQNRSWLVTSKRARTDSDGIANLAFEEGDRGQGFMVASWRDRQAILPFYGGYSRQNANDQWRIYAFTDRPAYRPEETVKWKITARIGGVNGYRIPSGERLEYQIRDPRGTEIKKGELRLNSFGSGWDELELDATTPLGEYRVEFRTIDPHSSVGSATLFRLEEYKLPEFRVLVTTEDEDGQARLYRLGDQVEATIDASYYFGGPVANATVEVVVFQNPYYRWWQPQRDFPWFFEERQPSPWYPGSGQEVKRETLRTDAEGRASLRFATPRSGNQDFEYRIEARVTDSSRREITGSGTIRVSRAPFFAEATPKHYLYEPGDDVEVSYRAVDANDHPAEAEGTVRITREHWKEIWLDPRGIEISGEALDSLRGRIGTFPPRQEPGQHAWTLMSRGYEKEEVRVDRFMTDSNGKASIAFRPDREGYYRVEWKAWPVRLSDPRPRDVVTTETTVWVATNRSTRIGYHRDGGIEILLDEESVRPGTTVPVMLVAPVSGRSVLFTIETDRIMSRQLVRMNGNVKLVEVQLGDEHIPNVFLAATMVADLTINQDVKELVVPPIEKFLTIEVEPDREEYQPRDRGTVHVTVKDAGGTPVSAELAVGVSDESVYSISEDLAGDPRKFFFGEKRYHNVRLDSSFNFRRYGKFVEEEGRVIDERLAKNEAFRRDRSEADAEAYAVGGVAGNAPRALEESVSMASQAPAPAMRQVAAKSAMAMDSLADDKDASQAVAGDSVTVRSDFRSTVFWQPDIVTDMSGHATVELEYPDSLTAWRTTARAATTASQFGIGEATSRTNKPLIVRLQAPRFFVVGDETTISAVINNNTDSEVSAKAAIDISGLDLTGAPDRAISVDANGEARIDWVIKASQPGTARIRVGAATGNFSDAMEKTYAVEDHGIDVLVAAGGKVRGSEATINLRVPAERNRNSTTMTVQVTPSIAVTMLDAIPYLIDYPYGCTEQTMSRFLPTVVASKTLVDLGVSRETVATKLFGGIEQSTAEETHKKGKRDLARLDEMTRAGLARLYDFQHSDGGWGWWKEGDSDRFMSAYVVWGLALAKNADVNVRQDVLDRGVQFLVTALVQEETHPERQAWMLHAISTAQSIRSSDAMVGKAFDNTWAKRDRLTAYGVSLLAISAHQFGMNDKARTLARNLENGAVIDNAPDKSILVRGSGSGSNTVMGTAHWGSTNRWWRWHDGPVESTSFALRALSLIDPSHRLVEPAMNWLVKNRRGAQWSNTRDTAIAVLSLNEYLRSSGELGSDLSFDVVVNGTKVATRSVSRNEIVGAPSRFEVPLSAIRDGNNEIVVRQTRGSGPLYLSAEAKFFSREEPVKASGSELFVKREYFRIVPHPTLLAGYVYDKVPLDDGGAVNSGDRIEVVVTVESKNDYEYLIFEDLKPAGFEATSVRSGEPLYAGRLRAPDVEAKHGENAKRVAAPPVPEASPSYVGQTPVYQELRDRKIAMFIARLDQGVWEIRYTLRAEVPGKFHALPVVGQAMYVPEIRGNGGEVRVTVKE